MSEEFREDALVELAAIEAGVFQFGQRVRAFLQALPVDLPQPSSASPSLSPRGLADAYLHLMFRTPDEVASWAAWMGTTLERTDQYGAVFTKATAVMGGLPIWAGCMDLASKDGQQTGDGQ